MPRESVGHTFLVAFVLCIVCSVLVSAAAVLLRPRQEVNRQLEVQKNILLAAGILTEDEATDARVRELSERVEKRLVRLGEDGEFVTDPPPGLDLNEYDQRRGARDPDLSVVIPEDEDLAGIRRREIYSWMYFIMDDSGQVEYLVLPVYGRGLWSTLYGFVALYYPELDTIRGLTFYEHGETPGLGGEVDNDAWKAQWDGKQPFNPEWDVMIRVTRPGAAVSEELAISNIDGLSGATITSRGVENLVRYWLGDHAFGPILQQIREQPESIEQQLNLNQ